MNNLISPVAPRGAARGEALAPTGTRGVLAPPGTAAGGARVTFGAAVDPTGAGGPGAAVAAAPAAAEGGASAAAGLVEAGLAPRPSAPCHVGFAAHAGEDGSCRKLVLHF